MIHLLGWAGLEGKLDIEFLLWSLRNVSGDKITIMECLLPSDLCHAEVIRFHAAMDELRDKAVQQRDESTLEFITRLEVSPVLRWETQGMILRTSDRKE